MVSITSNQHSYSNASALLSVTATAERTGADKISITANWSITTAGSTLASASRYLVLYLNSSSGTKYFSSVIGSSWSSGTTYTGSYTFKDIPLDAASTSIKIGFGVSASDSDMSTSGTLIWNGESSVSSSSYDSDIQFNSITGIAKGYTACTEPATFEFDSVFEDTITFEWSGAKSGENNDINNYSIRCAVSTDGGATWSAWTTVWTDMRIEGKETVSLNLAWLSQFDIVMARGNCLKFCIRTLGSAGQSYYSDWKEGDHYARQNRLPYPVPVGAIDGYYGPAFVTRDPSTKVTTTEYTPGDEIELYWSFFGDADNNLKGGNFEVQYRLLSDEGEIISSAENDGWVALESKENTTGEGHYFYTVKPTGIGYHESIQYRVRAIDVLGAASETWIVSNMLRRNDEPVLYVRSSVEAAYDANNDAYVIQICEDASAEDPVIGKYMPWVYTNGSWVRLAGKGDE